MKRYQFNNKIVILLFIIITTMFCLNMVSADSSYLSQELETIDNGTVSGGVYSDTFYGFDDKHVNINYTDTIKKDIPSSNSSIDDDYISDTTSSSTTYEDIQSDFNDRNATYVFKPLDSNAKIRSAHLITAVYIANMNRNYPIPIELTFNGKTYLNETLNSVYVNSEGPTVINENITRVTSDYLIHLNVTDNVNVDSNYVHIDVSNSDLGQIKMSTLIVAYDDDDYDLYYYTINYGHDVVNIEDYAGQTRFHGVYSGSRVSNATLTAYYLASVNGAYKFNDDILETYPPQAGYGGISSWDVTRRYRIGSDNNVLTYEKIGSYFKISTATMLVQFTNRNLVPDLTVKDIKINPNDYNYNNTFMLDNTNEIVIDLENIGPRDVKEFNVTLYVGNTSYNKTLTKLNSLESSSVIFNVDSNLTDKNVRLNVIIDEYNLVPEVSTSNNQMQVDINTTYTKFPHLNVSNMIFEENILINKKTTVGVNITNDGYYKANNANISVYVDDGNSRQLIKNYMIDSLNVGDSILTNINWTPSDYGLFTLIVMINNSDNETELTFNNEEYNYSIIVDNPNKLSIFIISDNSGTNSYNQASKSILSEYAGLIDIQIRTDNQALTMSDQELKAYLESSDIFIADWLSSGIYEKLDKLIQNNPGITNNKLNKIFLILEPPVSTTASSVDLIKNSSFKIKGTNKIASIHNISSEILYDYYFNTTRGLLYTDVYAYVNNSSAIPEIYNQATLYKDLSSVDGHRNMLLWLLNSINPSKFNKKYELPPVTLNEPVYGIYREKWYSYIDNNGNWVDGFEDYAKEYINSTRPTIALIESKMYVDSQQLQPYYEIISKLESLELNVIPLVAYGGTNEQLEVMYKTLTNASTLEEFMDNTSSYDIRIDALINMVAYGLGGTDFSKVTPFFTKLNVPILKAVHSDYVSNTEYDLGTTGLGALGGDKWWHITISEAQGAVTPTFVGGYAYTIDEDTGASISGYVPHEGNIEVLVNSIYNWALLKHLSNQEKKVALIYYNYPPGKQNIAASYMDPVESTLNLLNILKDNGYNVKNIPKNSTILLAQMLSQGTNVANWANGLVEVMADFRNSSYDEIYGYQYNNTYQIDLENMTEEEIASLKDTPGVLLYPVSKFKQWYDKLDDINKLTISEGPIAYIGEYSRQAVLLNYSNFTKNIDLWYDGVKELVPSNKAGLIIPLLDQITSQLKLYVQTANESYYDKYLTLKEEFLSYKVEGLSGWGEFPGNIMVVEREGIQYFVLPGIQYGNVFIAPEPQRGWEGNAEQLYHNSIVPPHYQYLAFYSYLQEEKYNAMVFMGRHATHEWLSGKEVLCSDTDFTTVITGSIPQIYFYITDGISEGLTAKRRASAVIIDHLTPPMTLTNLYGNLSYLHTLTEEYEVADKDKRSELAVKMREIILAEEYDRDMAIDLDVLDDDELVAKINDYVNALTSTLYPYGVHVIGQNWSDEEIGLLVTSMLSSEFEYNEAGDTTSLLDEVSLLYENKTYMQLSASKRTTIQNKALNIINKLIVDGKTDTINNLTDSSTEALDKTLDLAIQYINTLKQSTDNEVKSFLNALNSGFVAPGTGGDPVNNPGAIDTGKNFYQDQSSEIPTKIAYDKSKELLDITLEKLDADTRKIVLGIWDTETARDDGQLISLVLRLLGMKPTWSSSPSAGADGKKLRETPEYELLEDMYRPEGWNNTRLDVVIVLDGNFRDLYSRQVGLMDKAFRIALARSYNSIVNNQTLLDKYGDDLLTAINGVMDGIGYYGVASESLEENAVAENWIKDFEYYMSINMTPQQAGESAISRIFAPPESDYGALISQAVRQSWTFNDSKELADKYINRMGYIYSSTNWGAYNSKVLERLLNGTTYLFTSRNTNLYGIIDNDDYFDYWGGLYNAMYYINNKEIEFNVIRYGDSINTTLIDIGQYLKREMNTRYYNAEWIKAMMEQDYAGSSYMSRFASNLYGWASVTDKVTNKDWDNMVSVYIDDKYGIGVNKFLTTGYNSYAMISMTGTLLTAAYENKWSASDETLRKVANIWAQGIVDNGVACCDCSCGNIFMMDWSFKYINADLLSKLKPKLAQATQNKMFYDTGYGEEDNQNGNMNGTDQSGDSNSTSEGNNTGDTNSTVDGNGTGGNNSTSGGNNTLPSNNTAEGNSTSEMNNNSTNSTTNTNSTTDTNSTTESNPTTEINNTSNNDGNSTNNQTTPPSNQTIPMPIYNDTSRPEPEDKPKPSPTPSNDNTKPNNPTVDNNQTNVPDDNKPQHNDNSPTNTTPIANNTSTDSNVPANNTPVDDNNHTDSDVPINNTQPDTNIPANPQIDVTPVENNTQSENTSDYSNQTPSKVNNTNVPDTEVQNDNQDINKTHENNQQSNNSNNTQKEQDNSNTAAGENIKTHEIPMDQIVEEESKKQEDQETVNINTPDSTNQQPDSQAANKQQESVTEITINKQNIQNQEVYTTASVSKAHELNPIKKGSAITESAMSALAIIFVLALLGSIAYGYYNKRDTN